MTPDTKPAKVAFITGAGGEIGAAVARAFAREGTALVLTDLNEDSVASLAGTLPVPVKTYAHDVTDFEATRRIAEDAAAVFGSIDHVVTSAGLYQHIGIHEATFDQWRRSLAINLDGTFATIRCLLPHLAEGSAIVNIASVAGHKGSIDHSPYAAAKGGVITLTRSLAQELAPKTRVNAVSPGLIDTKMLQNMEPERRRATADALPLKRLGTSEEVASVVTFLCGPGAGYITGETIHVNGGLYMA